jgi:transposase
MDRATYRAAKAHLVAQMQAGQSWHEAAASVGLQTSRSSAYRLLRRVRTEGAVALDDQRHGHPTKVRQPVREWLAAFCRAAPEATGRTVQTAILERFGLEVSVSQINRLRAALGVRRQGSGAGEKSAERVAGSANLV